MKNLNLKSLAILGLFFMLAVASAHAQSGSRVEAHIPFDFAAGETKFKAGEYSVKRISKDALLLKSADQKTSAIVQAPESVSQTRNDSPERLVFHRYGNEYFLAQVWLSKGADGRAIYPSKTERQRARELARNNAKPTNVEVAARGN